MQLKDLAEHTPENLFAHIVRQIPTWRRADTIKLAERPPAAYSANETMNWFKNRGMGSRQARVWMACLYVGGALPCKLEPTPAELDLVQAVRETSDLFYRWLDKHTDWLPVNIAIELHVREEWVMVALAWFSLPISLVQRAALPTKEPDKVPNETMNAIFHEVRAGFSMRSIATRYGVPIEYVRSFVRDRAVKPTPELLPDFESYDHAASHWGVTRAQAKARLRGMGITLGRVSQLARHQQWRDDLDKFKSIGMCARKWGVSYDTAYARATRLRPKQWGQLTKSH